MMSYPQGPPPGQQPGAPGRLRSRAPALPQPHPQPYGTQQQWHPMARAHPHPEPRSYPLMLRTWDYAWWKPVVGILMFVVGGLLVMPLLLIPVLALLGRDRGRVGVLHGPLRGVDQPRVGHPVPMLYLNLTLASLTVVAMVIVRLIHRLRPRWLSSVMPGIRWKFFFVCVGLAVVALVVSIVVSELLPHQAGGDIGGEMNELTGTLVATGIVILVTTPFQALGEEYAFRGYLMQAFGSLTHGIASGLGIDRKWASAIASGFALVITSGLFALAHGDPELPLVLRPLRIRSDGGARGHPRGWPRGRHRPAHPQQPVGLRDRHLLR